MRKSFDIRYDDARAGEYGQVLSHLGDCHYDLASAIRARHLDRGTHARLVTRQPSHTHVAQRRHLDETMKHTDQITERCAQLTLQKRRSGTELRVCAPDRIPRVLHVAPHDLSRI